MHKPTLDWLTEHYVFEAVMTAMRGPDMETPSTGNAPPPLEGCKLSWEAIKDVTTAVLRWAVGFSYGAQVAGTQWLKGLPDPESWHLLNSHFFSHVLYARDALEAHGYVLPNRIPLTAYTDPLIAWGVGEEILASIMDKSQYAADSGVVDIVSGARTRLYKQKEGIKLTLHAS